MSLEEAIVVCIDEWSKIQNVKTNSLSDHSDWFFDMSNWPSGGFFWFSQQLRNWQKATKIPAK